MSVAKNASAIQFNGGNVLASSWPYGTDGRAALPLTHFTLWSEPIGGYVLTGSPFSLGIVLSSAKTGAILRRGVAIVPSAQRYIRSVARLPPRG